MTREEEIKEAAEMYYGDMYHKYPKEYFTEGAQWADEHPKNNWQDVLTEEPKRDQDVFAYVPNLCGGEYCKLTYLGNYRWRQDEGDYTFDTYNNRVIWMPIPEITKGGRV